VVTSPAVARPRLLLYPAAASTEGVRLLRILLMRQTFGAVARRVGCHAGLVRRWAREECRPSWQWRVVVEAVAGIQAAAWDDAPRAEQ